MADPTLDALWQAVLGAWSDDASHALFIAGCRRAKRLGFAAERYREEARRSGDYRTGGQRFETAQKHLRAITALALLELHASRAAPAPGRQITRIRWGVAMLFVVALTIVALDLLWR